MSDFPATVILLGAQHPTHMPDFGLREALVVAAGAFAGKKSDADMRVMWALGAVVGTCCPGLQSRSKITLANEGWDVLVFGRRFYSWCREQGATAEDLGKAGNALLEAIGATLMPAGEEVDNVRDFSKAEGGRG